MDFQIGDLSLYSQILGAFLTAMGIGKGSQWALRRYGNGSAQKFEPITRMDFREEVRPYAEIQKQIVAEQQKTTEAVRELTIATKEQNSFLRGFLEGKR